MVTISVGKPAVAKGVTVFALSDKTVEDAAECEFTCDEKKKKKKRRGLKFQALFFFPSNPTPCSQLSQKSLIGMWTLKAPSACWRTIELENV